MEEKQKLWKVMAEGRIERAITSVKDTFEASGIHGDLITNENKPFLQELYKKNLLGHYTIHD